MSRRVLFLALLLALASRPAPPEPVYASPDGTWTTVLPEGWTAAPQTPGAVKISGPEGPLVAMRVETLRGQPALTILAGQMKHGLKSAGTACENESTECLSGALTAWTCEYRQEFDGLPMQVVQTLVDGGTVKLLVTLAGPEPLSPRARGACSALLGSVVLYPSEERPPDAAEQSFPGGLTADLPAGAAAEPSPGLLHLSWEDRGLVFTARWRRTAAPPAEVARFDVEGFDPTEEQGYALEPLKTEAVTVAGKPGHLVRFYLGKDGVRWMTIAILYRASGPGEVVSLGFAFLGEKTLEAILPYEQMLTTAKTEPYFAPPVRKPQVPSVASAIWGGQGKAKFPEGWSAAADSASERPTGSPAPAESLLWSADRAHDLGIRTETGTIPGGATGFAAWLGGKRYKKREVARIAAARPVKVGGRDGTAWDIAHGIASNRWASTVITVFDGDRYWMIAADCPAALQGTYGGLAERVAETVQWTQK